MIDALSRRSLRRQVFSLEAGDAAVYGSLATAMDKAVERVQTRGARQVVWVHVQLNSYLPPEHRGLIWIIQDVR